jgi:cytoskeletal protein CcmA (bactofilin family)
MAANVTTIGRSSRVRGRIVGAADLEVLGYVEGEISVDGDVTIDATGIVGASVQGRKLVVRGAVKGDLTGEEAVLLEEGARVVGDVRAPRVAIAQGALVRGYVQTGEAGAAPRAAGRAHAAASPRATAAGAAHPKAAPPPPAAKAAPQPPPPSAPAIRVAGGRPEAAASAGGAGPASGDRGARRPPPPIVPVLKKAKGQLAKKKER